MEEEYVRCPNESYQISQKICEARQARQYPKCRKCKLAGRFEK